MATATTRKGLQAAERFVLRDIGWEGYQTMLELTKNRHVKLVYHKGNLELMSPLPLHERYKYLFGRMIDEITIGLDIPVVATGETTFKREVLDSGLEPDQCYYFASADRIKDWHNVDFDVDPPPDLAFEVDITNSSVDKMAVYAALGVPEVWRFDGEELTVERLDETGAYRPSETSGILPFLPMKEIERFLIHYDVNNDTRWGQAFRKWVSEELVTRRGVQED